MVLLKYLRFSSLLLYILSDRSKIDANKNIVMMCTGLKL